MKKTKVGLVGCGRWGQFILRDLNELGCDIHVVARSDESRTRAERGCSASIVREVGELPECDGYIVAVSTKAHARVIKALLPQRKPIFVEKPLCASWEEVEDLRRQWTVVDEPPKIFVMDKWRYHPGIEVLRDLARKGDLGEIRILDTKRLGWGNGHSDVGPAWHLLPHDLAITLEILGQLPLFFRSSATSGEGDRVTMKLCSITAQGVSVFNEISTVEPAVRREITVMGSTGWARLPGSYDNSIVVCRGFDELGKMVDHPANVEIVKTTDDMPLFLELKAFVQYVRGEGDPPRSSLSEGMDIVDLISQATSVRLRWPP